MSPPRRRGGWSRPEWEPARPLAVTGGLAARSTRGRIGATWWSQRFIAVLESLGAGGRLTRGKAYARKGQVLSLDLVPGVVHGSVQGSRPQPYEVWITYPVLPAPVWDRIEQALAGQALFAAQLLGGDLPAELEDVVAEAGGHLFPRSFGDLSMRCTCPDHGMPCKHLAAAFYLLAESFDDDPFRILAWRGRTRDQVLAGLGDALPAGADDGPAGDTAGPGLDADLADLPGTTAEDAIDRFWVAPVPLPPRPVTLDAPVDVLVRQLDAPPAALGGAGTAERVAALYRRLGRAPDDEGHSQSEIP